MTKIFLDSDILLDVAFDRKPFSIDAAKIVGLCEKNLIHGCTSALSLANCYYIIASRIDKNTAKKIIAKYRETLLVLDFTNKEIGEALQAGFADLEDGIQHFIAVNNRINTLITRNIDDYKKATINILKPEQYLNLSTLREMIQNNAD